MTIEGAIRLLDPETAMEAIKSYNEFETYALRASSPPAKLDKSRWEGCEMCRAECGEEGWGEGGAHDFRVNDDALYFFDTQYGWEGVKIKYCPFCGRPLTEEDWAELERRVGGNNDN